MKFHRINALVMRHMYLYQRSLPRLMDIFFWPIVELLVWGFLSVYLQKLDVSGVNIITLLLGAIIFWDFLAQSQRAVSVVFLEDVWERNFLNIFVSPLKLSEFLASTIILGLIRIFFVGIVMFVLSFFLYNFNLFQFGFYLIPFVLNLLVFGWALGLFTTAIIWRFGTSAQVLAFGFIVLLQPFSVVFYPVSALPAWASFISCLLPSSYVFEGMRSVVNSGVLPLRELLLSFGTNAVYLVLIIWFFYTMFKRVKIQGRLLKLD